MLICPIRHHSPAGALQVARLVRERRPRAVLVEGPDDATPLIPLLLDAETRPPVAVYAYVAQPVGTGWEAEAARGVRAVYYPFCEYSPEYAALKVGRELGAELQFCDVPSSFALGEREDVEDTGDKEGQAGKAGREAKAAPDSLPGFGAFAEAVTEASGFDSFEEFWEAAFEQDGGARTGEEYVGLLATLGEQARSFDDAARGARNDVRERHMASAARTLVSQGIPAEAIVLVCGAAHAASIARYFQDGTAIPLGADKGEGRPETQLALIPFSYPRLSEQLGYGAGNRAPWYYQEAWRRGGDFGAATRRGLSELARHLRRLGHMASVAQCIDGYTLASTLARMRGKRGPGVDELREAAVSCFGGGNESVVAEALERVLIGDEVGRVTPAVGRTPLQAEFYATAGELGVPVQDAPRQVLLHMVTPREAAQSVFLHRLVVAGVPFGVERESGLGSRGPASTDPVEQLARVREKWELQWSPATDAQLVERAAWGSTLREVCGRLLGEKLAAAQRIDEGTGVLLRLALCDLRQALPGALARCEALAAEAASFAPLARGAYHLDGLLSYGAARRLPAEQLGALAQRLFARAAVHLPAAAVCGDEAASEVRSALTALHELARRGSAAARDAEGLWRAIALVAERAETNAGLRGLALCLLELEGRLGRDELAGRLRYWLSQVEEAEENARLIAGLFALHRGTLVRNAALVGAVTDFLASLSMERLTPLLPVLRRGLGDLSGAERTYLSETLARVLGMEAGAATQSLRLSETEVEVLREADAAVEAVLAGWKVRYGIG